MTTLSQRIEALLFILGESITKADLAQKVSASLEDTERSIEEIRSCLGSHGIALITTGTSVQLTTSPLVSDFIAAFMEENETELSKAASETLAIIAYRGPISRYDVDVIRGVDSRRMIHILMHRGIIEAVPPYQRTRKYDVTEKFLSHMGLTNKKELPDFETLSNNDRLRSLLTAEAQPDFHHS